MPLRKSLSEQSKPAKRSKSHSVLQQEQRTAKPPAAASETSRAKLQKFRHQPSKAPELPTEPPKRTGVPDGAAVIVIDDESDKENQTGSGPQATPPVAAPPVAAPDPVRTVAGRAVAETPLAGLVWQDLISTADTAIEDEDSSPSERLLWRNESDRRPSETALVQSRRGKKRARSSSPTSSPANAKPHTPGAGGEALLSPCTGPTLDLWNRFSMTGKTAATPDDKARRALAQLMASSSPQPATKKDGAVPHGESGLRRAISCGTNWPKRRRIERPDADTSSRGLYHRKDAASKDAMVTALLQSVTGEISRSDALQTRRRPRGEVSPAKRAGQSQDASPVPGHGVTRAVEEAAAQSPDVETPQLAGAPEPTSDYGDDEFDEDTIMELNASLLHVDTDEATQTPAPGPGHDGVPRAESSQEANILEDEFGDLDADFFAAAEDIVAEIDSKHNTQSDDGRQPRNMKGAVRDGNNSAGVLDQTEDLCDSDLDDFDFTAVEDAAIQSLGSTAASVASPSNSSQKPWAIQRYIVTSVLEASYVDNRGHEFAEKVLVVQADRSGPIRTVHLREDWIETPASAKAYVHIIGAFGSTGMCIIDNTNNMLILHPDQLVSATVVADSFGCMRRTVLQDRVKATSDASPALIYGTLLHEIFQEALMANKWDAGFLGKTIGETIQKHIEDLYTIKVQVGDAREHLLSKMTELRGWAEVFMSSQPKPNALVRGRNGEQISMCVSKLLDVEEHVWSPTYGLKGNIDATVQVTMKDGKDTRTLTVPLELKTGKYVNSNHQAQTVLYNLLLSDRYDVEIVYGILYYMETSQTLRIPTIRHELRQMIMQRNQLACHIRERSVHLPPMKKSSAACARCYAQTPCFIYHKLADNGDGETSGVGDLFSNLVQHLEPAHRDFFLKWEDLLTKEEKQTRGMRRELWTMLGPEREKAGRCFANVVIEEGSAHEDKNTAKINRFQYTFIKENPGPRFSFLDSQLTLGEPVVVSDDQGHLALALGYVTSVRSQRIGVAVDRRLHNARIRQAGFDQCTNQVFSGIMEVAPEGVKAEDPRGKITLPPVRYRLDKDEFSNGMALVRNNLIQVMADGPSSREIRRLVVELASPSFKAAPTQYTIKDGESLNVDQQRAIEKVMSAHDYALVLGMPGTGKTFTIAHIIRALVGQNKSVLLTSYTHTAVDNILLKLKHDHMPVLRLGVPSKVHPEIREFAILAGQPKTFDEIHEAWHGTQVVATTCLGINHAIFNERTFDYCIVDEASQITLPICLGPIRMARTFVLVGDHNQLPPLVQNDDARAGGLDVSLFKLLSDTHPDSVVNLEHQYRMSEDIMTLSNTLIYSGRLKCGTDALRHRTLHVPNLAAVGTRHHHDAASFLRSGPSQPAALCTGSPRCWLRDLLQPLNRVAFVNTDAIAGSREEAKGSRIVNECEARLVAQLVEALQTAGVPASEIGVMTHYRSQLALLKHHLRANSNIEMHTADRFQGRDKEVMVLSLVRSNDRCHIGDLLKDWRRINVAFTRAKTKLLVVGSRSTLKGCGEDEMLARFVGLMEDRDWVYDLPADALESHVFEAFGSQVPPAGGPDTTSMAARRKSQSSSPKKKADARARLARPAAGKENAAPTGPKRAKVGEKVLLKGKLITRDILNEMMDGIF